MIPVAGGVLAGLIVGALLVWWLTRTIEVDETDVPGRTEQCECGRLISGPDLHLVVAGGDDDADLGIDTSGGGGTFMSAAFCPEHCPGGCRHGCDP